MSACPRRDDAGSYVLHALPDDEHERFEAHLATCADCRREVADLQVAADTLPLAAVQVGPPPELRERIMTIVRSEAELLAAAEARGDQPSVTPAAPAPRRRRRWSLSLRPLPAEQCKVIELAYFGGFTHSEIALMLDTPIGTVKGRMRLGLEKLRGQLGGLAEAMT